MSTVKTGLSLRTLALTPDRIPSFLVPSRSRFLASPRLHRCSTDRARLLSDSDSTDASPPVTPTGLVVTSPCLLRAPAPRLGRLRRAAATAEDDTDATTQAATSLAHVPKVTTSYGFRAVSAASPCTNRRESLFHRSKPVKVTATKAGAQDPETLHSPGPDGSRASIRPVKALGLQVMKELKKPVAALKALSPSYRIPSPR